MQKDKLNLRNPPSEPGTSPVMKEYNPNPAPTRRTLRWQELVLMAFLSLVMFGMYRTCENNHVEVTGPVTIDCNLTQ